MSPKHFLLVVPGVHLKEMFELERSPARLQSQMKYRELHWSPSMAAHEERGRGGGEGKGKKKERWKNVPLDTPYKCGVRGMH